MRLVDKNSSKADTVSVRDFSMYRRFGFAILTRTQLS